MVGQGYHVQAGMLLRIVQDLLDASDTIAICTMHMQIRTPQFPFAIRLLWRHLTPLFQHGSTSNICQRIRLLIVFLCNHAVLSRPDLLPVHVRRVR